MRRLIFNFICKRILKLSEGELAPDWLAFLLFPLFSYGLRFARVRYDFYRELYIIEGVKISKAVFLAWSEKGLPIGSYFQLLSREDGTISIKEFKLPEKLE